MPQRPQPISPAVRKAKPAGNGVTASNHLGDGFTANIPKPAKVDPIEELKRQVTRLRQAIKTWLRSDTAFDALSNIQEGEASMPIIDMVLPNKKEGTTSTVSFDLARIPQPDAVAMVDALLGASIADYEESLLEIVHASQAAYAALQKQKEM
jgi:hypothetical protein